MSAAETSTATIALCAALLLLTTILAFSPSAYASPTYTEPAITIAQGQSQSFSYQFCGGGMGGSTSGNYVMNVTAYSEVPYSTSYWYQLGVTGIDDCVTGQFTIAIPMSATPGTIEGSMIVYCYVYPPGVPPNGLQNMVGFCQNDQAEYDWSITITGSTPLNAVSITVTCDPEKFVAGVGSTQCTAQLAGAVNPTGTIAFSTNSTEGSFNPGTCTPGSNMACSTTYTDTLVGTALVTAKYSGDSQNAAASNSTDVFVSAKPSDFVTFSCTPENFEAGGETGCSAQLVDGINPTGTFTFTTTSKTGYFNPPTCKLSGIALCGTFYHDSAPGTVTITASYSGDAQNPAASDSTTITVTPASCPDMWLTEGLAPAASTTGDDNVYVTIHWDGQTPVSVDLAAAPSSATMGISFTFNPVTMQGSATTVLMNVMTQNTADGTYTIDVAARLTNPQNNQPCDATMTATVTVAATSVFVGTGGQNASTAVWLNGLSSPFMISGNITASQYSNYMTHLGPNNLLSSLTFTVTGQEGTTGVGTLTIPKILVPSNYVPVLTIDGIKANIRVTQDATSFYITYTTRFTTHNIALTFVQTGSPTAGTTGTTTNTTATGNGTASTTSSSTPSSEVGTTALIIGIVVLGIIATGIYFAVRTISRGIGRRRAKGRGQKTAPSSSGTDLFCTNCGKPRKPGASFCTGCGADLRTA